MCGHLECTCNAQNDGKQQNQLPAFLAAVGRDQQDQGNERLARHTGGEDTPAVEVIGGMPGGKCEQQRRYELKKPDQAEIPGAARDVVHLPTDGHHQHLVGHHGRQAGK